MIKEFEFYHGIVFSQILHAREKPFSIRRDLADSNASYIIDENIGIYIKYSTKRLTPWRFSFSKKHYDEIVGMKQGLGSVFILFVCGEDGIVCLSFFEFVCVLNNVIISNWISIRREKGEMYKVKGADGELETKIGRNEFPGKLFKEQCLPLPV
jgi:hypothetical protein